MSSISHKKCQLVQLDYLKITFLIPHQLLIIFSNSETFIKKNYVAQKYVATERPNQAMLAEVVQRISAEIMICQATNVLCMLTVLIRFQSVSIQTLCHTST